MQDYHEKENSFNQEDGFQVAFAISDIKKDDDYVYTGDIVREDLLFRSTNYSVLPLQARRFGQVLSLEKVLS